MDGRVIGLLGILCLLAIQAKAHSNGEIGQTQKSPKDCICIKSEGACKMTKDKCEDEVCSVRESFECQSCSGNDCDCVYNVFEDRVAEVCVKDPIFLPYGNSRRGGGRSIDRRQIIDLESEGEGPERKRGLKKVVKKIKDKIKKFQTKVKQKVKKIQKKLRRFFRKSKRNRRQRSRKGNRIRKNRKGGQKPIIKIPRPKKPKLRMRPRIRKPRVRRPKYGKRRNGRKRRRPKYGRRPRPSSQDCDEEFPVWQGWSEWGSWSPIVRGY